MELIYSALLLHEAKQNIDEANLTKVLQAAGLTPDAAKFPPPGILLTSKQ